MPPTLTEKEPRAARRGRPPIEDLEEEAVDETDNKRIRMRRAQRAYRTRKEETLISEKARSEQLSKALDDAMETFISFHRRIYEFHQKRHSPDLLFHLNQAFMQMNEIARSANKEAHFTHFPRPSQTPHLRPFHQAPEATPLGTATTAVLPDERNNGFGLMPSSVPYQSTMPTSGPMALFLRTGSSNPAVISERIYKACLERVVSLLTSDYESRSPTLFLPLQSLGEEVLMVSSLQSLSVLPTPVADFQYPSHTNARLPPMYRVVEGESNAIPRLPSPSVQQIVRGRTRTTLITGLVPLQGEWLEARDVEEYLEQRGISLRSTIPNGAASLEGYGHRVFGAGSERNNTLQNRRILPRNATPDLLTQVPGVGLTELQTQRPQNVNGMPSSSSIDWDRHEPTDLSIFGVQGHQPSGTPDTPRLTKMRRVIHISVPDLLRTDLSLLSYQDVHDPHLTSQITIDLDKLVQHLAANATYLGPVPGIRKTAVDFSIRESIITL